MTILEYPRFLPKVLAYDHYFGAVLGVFLNSIVLIGLNLRRCRSLGKYRWFMMAHTFNDLISAITMGMLELFFDFSGGYFVMIVNGPLTNIGQGIGKAIFMIFASCFVMNMELLALTFVYRYCQICRKHLVHHFSKRRFIILMLVLVFVPLGGVDAAMYFAYAFTHKFLIRAGDLVYGVRALYVEEIVCVSFLITCAMFISMATLSYVIVFTCCKAIFSTLKRVENSVTERTKRTQRILTIVLLLQAVTPVLTSTLPAVGMIIGILLQLEQVRWIAWTLSATFIWLPTLNAIISLSFISPLRSIFCAKLRRKRVASLSWATKV